MLTREQQQLAAQYHGAIVSFCKEYKLDISEWYGLLAIALCNAAKAYEPSRGKTFLTLAYQSMRHIIWNEYKRLGRKKRIQPEHIISYNRLMEGHGNHVTEVIDKIDTSSRPNRLDVTAIEVDEFRSTLSDLQRCVLDGLMDGMLEREIAAELGYTKAGISWIKQQLKQKWQAYCAA